MKTLKSLYRRYVDDTVALMDDVSSAEAFLQTLNDCHLALDFTMGLSSDGKLPFLGMEIIRKGRKLETSVHRKNTNTGLLLHYQSHVDNRYKTSLLKTMLHRGYCLSSTKELFYEECDRLRDIFGALKYPSKLIESTIKSFQSRMTQSSESPTTEAATEDPKTVWFSLPSPIASPS